MTDSKPAIQSKTIWGIILTVAAAFATFIGIHPEGLGFISDGLQWEDVTAALTLVGAFIAWYGRTHAKKPVEGIVKQK